MKTAALPKTLLFSALTAAIAFAVPASAQELRFKFDPEHFRFEREDRRGNEGKRASCAVYAQIAVVQADTNRRYNCGYRGGRWDTIPMRIFVGAAMSRGKSLVTKQGSGRNICRVALIARAISMRRGRSGVNIA